MSRGRRKQERSGGGGSVTPAAPRGERRAGGAGPDVVGAASRRRRRSALLGAGMLAAALLVGYGVVRWRGAGDSRAGARSSEGGGGADGAAGGGVLPRPAAPREVPRIENLEALDPAVAAAIRAAIAAVEDEPSNSAAWGDLGVVYHAHRYFALAQSCYAEAWRLDPSTPDWPHLLGVLAEERGDLEEAVARYESELEQAPAHAAARYRLGNVLLQAGRVDDAARAFGQLAASAPGEPWGPLGLGRVALRRGTTADAAGHFERALAVDPDNTQIAYLLATAYRELGKQAEAWSFAERAGDGVRPGGPADPILDRVRSGVRSLQSLVATANRTLAAGNADVAEALYTTVLGSDPGHYDALYNLGILYGRQGRLPEAQAVLERAVAARPASSQARLLLALALLSQDRLDAARDQLLALLQRDPAHEEARSMLDQLGR